MGEAMSALFTDSPGSPNTQLSAPLQKLNLLDIAFSFELGALDRRLRAERVLRVATNLTIEGVAEQKLDRVMDSIASAYVDHDRAKFFETVADNMRYKAYQERIARHAA